MFRGIFSVGLLMVLPVFSVLAADGGPGLSFSYRDWVLACDNTYFCRAAGYQREGDKPEVSVSVSRKAGPGEPVLVSLVLGSYPDDPLVKSLPPEINLSMQINGKYLGKVLIGRTSLRGGLSTQQTEALLAALRYNSRIEWVLGEHRWRVSDKGATAVLLKMDEFQGRLGTTGALVKKGPANEDKVLQPLPQPVLISPPLSPVRPGDAQWVASQSPSLGKALRGTLGKAGDKARDEETCPKFDEKEHSGESLFVTRLSDSQLLVSAPCWSGAYNAGSAYWVINDETPYNPVLGKRPLFPPMKMP